MHEEEGRRAKAIGKRRKDERAKMLDIRQEISDFFRTKNQEARSNHRVYKGYFKEHKGVLRGEEPGQKEKGGKMKEQRC
ncbi:hypothetical protein H1R16_04235 [Marnyiella aurantia]|uniref:Uncharacterized protein n=1 Tax=Marnyiella aurantia TaxID=2758037 RepID=A0A7D7LNK9_9FLAO|nr:hypothetical protein [Marnyiella aurantia]MBA5247467.1 hypothetical protein [Marnyiella aurantia]QMS99222.1 hypothetical protein H1R16_04235 [Marnyiella aurantia]